MSATWNDKGEKATPVAADEVLIIDSEAAGNQVRATIGSFASMVWSRTAVSGFLFPATLTDTVGIGTATPQAALDVLSETEQLRLSADALNFTSFTTTLGAGFSIGTGFIDNIPPLNVNAQDITPRSLAFSTDGTKMFMVGSQNATVYQYVLTIGFDLSTAEYENVFFNASVDDPDPRDIAFSNDGTKMFILGNLTNIIRRYTLTTPFDLTISPTLDTPVFGVGDQDASPTGMAFNNDGTKMYMLGTTGVSNVYQYTLPTAFDFTDAVYDDVNVRVQDQDSSPRGLNFNTDGTKMFIVGLFNDLLYQYSLPTPFIVTGATFDDITLSFSGQTVAPRVGVFSTDGEKFYLITGERNIYQYSTATPNGLTISPTGENTNIKGNLTVDTNILFVNATSNNVGIGTITPTTKLHVLSTTPDTTALTTRESTGTNGGITATHVGDRDPNDDVTAAGGAEYLRDSGVTSKRYLSREATTGTLWDEYSTNPPLIIEIKDVADFDDLATGGIITISNNTTFIIKTESISTANRIVVNAGIVFHITGQSVATAQITYTGSDVFITSSGTVRILGNVLLTNISGAGTFIAQTGGGVLDIDNSTLESWNSLGSIEGVLVLQTMSFVSITGGLTLTNVSAVNVSGIKLLGTSLTGALFTINTNDQTARFAFDNSLFSSLAVNSAVFDIATTTSNSVVIGIQNCSKVTGDIFKQTQVVNDTINSVADNSPVAGTITAFANDVTGVSTTVSSSTTPYFEDEEVTITGTTSYNGTFQIFGVVAGVSFKIRTAFVANDATGSIASVRIDMTLAPGHDVTIGISIKVINSQFYNAFYTVLDLPTGNVITLNQTFVATDTGAIELNVSLDETDPRIRVIAVESVSDSTFIAFGSMNSNGSTTTITDEAYLPVNLTALISDEITERFKLIDQTLGIWEYIGNEPFNGFLTGALWAVNATTTRNYRFAMSIDGVAPVFLTAPYSPMQIKLTQESIPLELVVNLEKSQTIQIMVAGDATGDNITITDLRMGIH